MNEIKLGYKYLGPTGIQVSELCLGCMTFGEKDRWGGFPTMKDSVTFDIINRFVEVGGNFLDTANIYGNSEIVLGQWLESSCKRDKYVIATKVGSTMGSGPNDVGLSRRSIIHNVELSLENLKTNYIDLYQSHIFDFGTDLKETLTTFNDLVRCGKVRYLGCSNILGYQLQRALDISEFMGLEKYICIQPQYSLLSRGLEYELLNVIKENNLGVIPWSCLKGGWLSGRYKRGDEIPPDCRVAWAEKVGFKQTNSKDWKNDSTYDLLDKIKEIGDGMNATMSQVSLRWVMQKDWVTAPIIGARNIEQLNDNLGSVKITLSPEHMKFLNDFTNLPPAYPYEWLSVSNRKRIKI